MMNKKVLLMILDGWGIAQDASVSAVDVAKTPFVDGLYEKYPNSKLEASGLAVGLPEGQMGNSEVGHMNIGAGRVVDQTLVRINKAIVNQSLAQNEVLIETIHYVKEHHKKLHLIGLVSDGGVHAHINHLKAICSIAKQHDFHDVYIHVFTDGRDTDPNAGINYVSELQEHLAKTTGRIASITGRYYAMDRDKRWERVKLAYDAMVFGVGIKYSSPVKAIKDAYDMGITDEFIKPIICIDEDSLPVAKIRPQDAVISFNFRTDRGRQITEALTQSDFEEHGMRRMNLHYVTMTQYDEKFNHVKVLFQNENLRNTLGEILARADKKQIRIAETEKYPHVTFFFSGGHESEFKGETRIMCPSPKVATYDLQPEMSARDIQNAIIPKLESQEADFICLNFANPDMVGHTGVFDAVIKACETVDSCAQAVTESALRNHYTIMIIADHGNAEYMKNPDGSPHTAHTTNLVPCILVDNTYTKPLRNGKLGDLAPTILDLMGIQKPEEMTGLSLL